TTIGSLARAAGVTAFAGATAGVLAVPVAAKASATRDAGATTALLAGRAASVLVVPVTAKPSATREAGVTAAAGAASFTAGASRNKASGSVASFCIAAAAVS